LLARISTKDSQMKPLLPALSVLAGLTFATLMPDAAVAQSRGRDQVCVYEHADYGGWEQCYGVGEAIRDLGNRRNGISSVRIQGRAEITLFQHPDFQGNEVTIGENTPDLRGWSRAWNDETDSLRVSAPGFRGGRPDRDERRADRVCVYQHVNFQGKSQCWNAGAEERDLRNVGWNDGISSIRVFGPTRVAVYEHDDFQGQRLVVERDVPDLTAVRANGGSNWNDRISSIRVGDDADRRPGRRR
jgi:hypothetical protein